MKIKHVLSMLFVCFAFLALLGRGVSAALTAHAAADDENWSALGSGTNGCCFVIALATVDNNLYADGQFTAAGGVNANHIAQWDGSSCSPLDSSVNDCVEALATSGSNLYVGRLFTTAGGKTAT